MNTFNELFSHENRRRLHVGHSAHAGRQDILWVLPDSKEQFLKNKEDKKQAKKLRKAGWTATNVKYKYNTHGFRGDELEYSSDKSILFLGCSHTFGTGINHEDTMAYLVSKSLGYKCYNLSLIGGSINLLFSYAYHWIPKLKPDIVVLMQPHELRIGWYDGLKCPDAKAESDIGSWINLSPNNVKTLFQNALEFYMSWSSRTINTTLNMESNTLAIKQLCYENNAKCYTFSSEELFKSNKVDDARDLLHAGKQTNINAANFILDAINVND